MTMPSMDASALGPTFSAAPPSGVNTDPNALTNPIVTLQNLGSTSATLSSTSGSQKFAAGSGYWVAIGVIGSVLISNTKVAPVALGILSVALIYQTGMLIQGK